ncbi:hypothetical protein HDU77_000570 [Chytriomyces hyalinus]|nr:hypothetical protein HDU77_000570 [Chytriomyces hyalinus]
MDKSDLDALITLVASDAKWTQTQRDHISTALSEHNKAFALMEQGRLADSLALRTALLNKHLVPVLGSSHVLVQRFSLEIGELLGQLGRKEEAIESLTSSVSALRILVETPKLLHHATLVQATETLTEALKLLGTEYALTNDQYDKALKCFEEAENLNQKPVTHVFSLHLKAKIVMVWIFMISDGGPSEEQVEKLWKLAHALLLEIAENATTAMSNDDGAKPQPELVDILGEAYWRLSQLCKMIGNQDAALENLEKYVDVYSRKVSLASLPGCMDYCELSIESGSEKLKSSELREMVLQCVIVAKQAYGEGNVTYGIALQNQVSLLFRLNQFDEAIQVCMQIIRIEEASVNNAGRGKMMLAFLEDMKKQHGTK